MDKRFWEQPVCIVCDYWWAILLAIALLVSGLLAWNHFNPSEPRLGTGDVQMTLRWNNVNDIDLHVVSPNREHLYYSSPTSFDGGQLDVDSNAGCGEPLSARPVENIFWPQDGAPIGSYRVYVVYYAQCQLEAETDFNVIIKIDGKRQEFRGTLTQVGESQEVAIVGR